MMMCKTTARRGLTALAIFLLLLVATACRGNGSETGAIAGDPAGNEGSAEPKTVTVSVMTSNRFLELAKQKFEKAHPGINIDIKEYVAAPPTDGKLIVKAGDPQSADPKNVEKYASGVNTELMSGKASDLIFMDSLSYKKYADKKLLENLDALMKNDKNFHMDDYYTNIFDAMKYKDGLYVLPIGIQLQLLAGNPAALGGVKIDDGGWTWADWKNIVASAARDDNKDGAPDYYALAGLDRQPLLRTLLGTSYDKFVDEAGKKANFQSREFIDLLNLCKSLFDEKLIQPEMNRRSAAMFQPIHANEYAATLISLQATFDGQGVLYNMPAEHDANGTSFIPTMQLALNSKSKNKQEAWEFMKFLISEEMQSARELLSFAVNKKAGKAQQELAKAMTDPNSGAGSGSNPGQKQLRLMIDGKEFVPKPIEQKDLDVLERYVSGVKSAAQTDPKVLDIVLQETAPFFSGQKSAEDTAKIIQSKVSTYLQE
mgnify:CR=1 FL=1